MDIAWAQETFGQLLLTNDPIIALMNWSMNLASTGPPKSKGLWHAGDWEYLREELENRDLSTPPFGETEHDISLMVDYIDRVSLRKRDGVLGYSMGALAYLSRRLPFDATIRNHEYAETPAAPDCGRSHHCSQSRLGSLRQIKEQVPFVPIDGKLDAG
jgi:hypothetical protein